MCITYISVLVYYVKLSEIEKFSLAVKISLSYIFYFYFN